MCTLRLQGGKHAQRLRQHRTTDTRGERCTHPLSSSRTTCSSRCRRMSASWCPARAARVSERPMPLGQERQAEGPADSSPRGCTAHLAAEYASVHGVLPNLHLLDGLPNRSTIPGTVLTRDPNLLGALTLRSRKRSVVAAADESAGACYSQYAAARATRHAVSGVETVSRSGVCLCGECLEAGLGLGAPW